MNKILCTLLPLIITACFTLNAQKPAAVQPGGKALTATTIDSIIKKLMDTAEVTGMCIGIINNNNITYTKGYGYKNAVTQAYNDTVTGFYAASLAKPLFAYLVLQLADEGKIKLDKPLYQYLPKPLPEYDNYKDLAGDERWKLITARHCLSHTTGFPNWREYNPNDNNKLEIFFTPGQRYAYSGEGLYLLQLVVETITGKKLEALAQQYIFKPFGMQHTSFLWQPAFNSNCAWGHTMNEDTTILYKPVKENAAGSMTTTIADYSRFITAVLRGRGLSAKAKRQMFSPQIGIFTKHQFPSLNNDTTSLYKSIQLAYGLGWGLFNTPYGQAFFKEGHGNGWQHYTIAIPGKGYALIIMTNSDNGESMFKELVEKIAGLTIPWQWEGYTPYRQTVKLPTSYLQQFTGEYDGRLKAIVTLENGKLKVTSPTVNLPKTTLYAENDHHFFLKVMETELEFVRNADGKIEKAMLDDEGEHYELKKIK